MPARRKPTNAMHCVCRKHCFAYTSQWWIAIVSREDSHLLEEYKWRACGQYLDGNWYAQSKRYARETGKSESLHRAVTGHQWEMVDHINRNGHDCRRENLRESDPTRNAQNKRRCDAGVNGSSRYKGVSRVPSGKWSARIRIDGWLKWLGTFDDEAQAGLAYNNAALQYFGEYAYLNKITDGESL